MELADLGSLRPYASWAYMSNQHICHKQICVSQQKAASELCLFPVLPKQSRSVRCIGRFFPSTSDSFDPLTPDSKVAHDHAEGAKEEPQTQAHEKNCKRQDE